MKFLIASAAAMLMTGFVTANIEKANAVVYCQYVSYPTNCAAEPVVVLRARQVA
jgi:hypothetical protein